MQFNLEYEINTSMGATMPWVDIYMVMPEKKKRRAVGSIILNPNYGAGIEQCAEDVIVSALGKVFNDD